MNEEFDELIGGKGVDTQYERDILEYNPDLDYKPEKERLSEGLYGSDPDSAFYEKDIEDAYPDLEETWDDLIETTQRIDEQLNKLRLKLADLKIEVSSQFVDEIRDYLNTLKINFDGYLTIEIYEQLFDKIDKEPVRELIKNIFEEAVGDVYGDINAELFCNLVEMKVDWETTLNFSKKGLYGQIIDSNLISDMTQKDEQVVKQIQDFQESYKKAYEESEILANQSYETFMSSDLDNYSDTEINNMMDDLDNRQLEFDILKRQGYSSKEINNLINNKNGNVSSNLDLIENAVDLEAYEQKEEILNNLLRNFSSKDEMVEALEQMRMSLKLASDVENNKLMKARQDLRGISGNDIKKTISDNLLLGVQLQNKVVNTNYKILASMEDVDDNDEYDTFMNSIVQGTKATRATYENQLMDYYKITELDTKLREEKLSLEVQKEAIRGAFRMINGMYEHLSNDSVTVSSGKIGTVISSYLKTSKE